MRRKRMTGRVWKEWYDEGEKYTSQEEEKGMRRRKG